MNPDTPQKLPGIHIDSLWLPKANSTIAPDVDWAWDVVMVVSILFFLLLMGMMFWFMWRYRRRTEHDITSDRDENHFLERLWTIIPLGLCAWLFFVGYKGFLNASVPPAEAYEIQVTARRWGWNFTYPNGVMASELVVPQSRPVRLVMSSQDVLHSFYVAEFRVKRDIIPGIYTSLWFEAIEPMETTLQCTEYCGGAGDGSIGTGHSGMLAKVTVMTGGDFDRWLKKKEEEDNTLSPVELGRKVYVEKQCNGCHSLDGKPGSGPTFKGIFGKKEMMSDKTEITVDENYLRESILQAGAKTVAGYQPGLMPVFQGQLSEKQVNALVAFIKEQK